MAKAELQEIGLMKIELGEFIEVISGEGDGISTGSQLAIGTAVRFGCNQL